jgi:hypothetical protein
VVVVGDVVVVVSARDVVEVAVVGVVVGALVVVGDDSEVAVELPAQAAPRRTNRPV